MNAATLVPGAVDENYSWVGEHYRLVVLNAAAAITAAAAIISTAIISTAIISTAIIATAVTKSHIGNNIL